MGGSSQGVYKSGRVRGLIQSGFTRLNRRGLVLFFRFSFFFIGEALQEFVSECSFKECVKGKIITTVPK